MGTYMSRKAQDRHSWLNLWYPQSDINHYTSELLFSINRVVRRVSTSIFRILPFRRASIPSHGIRCVYVSKYLCMSDPVGDCWNVLFGSSREQCRVRVVAYILHRFGRFGALVLHEPLERAAHVRSITITTSWRRPRWRRHCTTTIDRAVYMRDVS